MRLVFESQAEEVRQPIPRRASSTTGGRAGRVECQTRLLGNGCRTLRSPLTAVSVFQHCHRTTFGPFLPVQRGDSRKAISPLKIGWSSIELMFLWGRGE